MKRSFPALGALLLLGVVSSCRCRPGPVEPIELGLRVAPTEVDFGRVLEGDTRTAEVVLTTTTRAPVSVTLHTNEPFGVMPTTIEVPGGGDATLTVRFRAGNGAAEDALTLTVGELSAQVPLKGFGVRPPPCLPSAECIISEYSLEEDRCIEHQAPDDSACDPASVCLEQGRCRSGQCLGVARRCDDDDACTDDACAMDVGCIHTPHQCPGPTALCQVATCDARAGCGFGPAPDLDRCGPIDCVEANFCFEGTCRKQMTPEGYPCSPAIACLPEAQCHNQTCQRVTVGDWDPDWSAPLQGTPTGSLNSLGPTIFFSMCIDGLDAGSLDAGVLDAGELDAGELDGGDSDAGALDAGTPDASVPLICGLSSYTGSGFLRFTRPYEDFAPRQVLGTNSEGVVVLRDGGLELRSTSTGVLRQSLAFAGRREQLVIARDSIYLLRGGELVAWSDGGVTAISAADTDAELASGDALFSWNADAGMLTRFDLQIDGGLAVHAANVGASLPDSLATVGSEAILGGAGRGALDDDGGFGWLSFDFSDAGYVERFDALTLSSAFATDVFVKRCDDAGACQLDVDAFDGLNGSLMWSAPVIRQSLDGKLIFATLIDGNVGESVVTVTRIETDAGPRAEVQLLAQGSRSALCRLRENSGAVELAHVANSSLVITTRRPDGGLVLESYGLGVLPVSRSGWPTTNGVLGSRSAQ
ncbi:MAG: hypothetical protein QM817_21935 [Archangium sp.]